MSWPIFMMKRVNTLSPFYIIDLYDYGTNIIVNYINHVTYSPLLNHLKSKQHGFIKDTTIEYRKMIHLKMHTIPYPKHY